MNYSEAAYFDGAHVAHIAAWQDHQRVLRLISRAEAVAAHCVRPNSNFASSLEAISVDNSRWARAAAVDWLPSNTGVGV